MTFKPSALPSLLQYVMIAIVALVFILILVSMVILLPVMLDINFRWWEVIYVIGAWFVYYRHWQNIPTETSARLTFVGPYFNHINLYTPIRLLILAMAMIGMIYLRRYMEEKLGEET